MQCTDEPCLAEKKTTRLTIQMEKLAQEKLIRRSTRDPNVSVLDRHDLAVLLNKIEKNHPSTVILKIKNHIQSDINSVVFDAIIEALWKNRVCQCLYIQNLSRAIGDEQLHRIVDLLKKKMIWGVNIGESYEVSQTGWQFFSNKLSETNVTHLYVSEHTIPIELKNEMRAHIRENRKKHDLHCAYKYLHVIERCTNMWWNPINGVKELKPPPPPKPVEPEEEDEPAPAPVIELTPAHTAYWQEGVGKGGEKPWKFSCMCGEVCSSYENFRYHPTGRMYECSNPACCLWSHVACVLGQISDDELAKRKDLLCGACKAKSRRLSKYLGVDITTLYAPVKEESAPGAGGSADGKGSKSKGKGKTSSSTDRAAEEDDGKPWKFKCKCGEVCSSYEKSIFHPAGQWYECSKCEVWSHVHCNLGNLTPAQVTALPEVLCFSCTTAARRSRKRAYGSEDVPAAAPAEAPVASPAENSCVVSTTAADAVTAVQTEGSASAVATVSTDAAAALETLPPVEDVALLLLATAAKPTDSVLCPEEAAVAVPEVPHVAVPEIPRVAERTAEHVPAYPCTVEADLPEVAAVVMEVDEASCMAARAADMAAWAAGVNVIE